MKLYDLLDWGKPSLHIEMVDLESNEQLFRKVFSEIEQGWTVVDIGSRIGYYTIKAGLAVGKRGVVLSVEPHPLTYRVLRMNIELYKLDNVIPIWKAVGSRCGKAMLFDDPFDSGGTSTIPPKLLQNFDKERFFRWMRFLKNGNMLKLLKGGLRRNTAQYVPIDTLDRIAGKYKRENIDLVKIDVQGAELDVLKGSKETLKKDMPILLVEVHPPMALAGGWKPEDLYALLNSYGYHLSIQKRHTNPMVVARPSNH